MENNEYYSRWLGIKARMGAASTRKEKSKREKTTGSLYKGGRQREVRVLLLGLSCSVYAINWKSKHMANGPCGHGSMGRKARKARKINKKHDDDGELCP